MCRPAVDDRFNDATRNERTTGPLSLERRFRSGQSDLEDADFCDGETVCKSQWPWPCHCRFAWLAPSADWLRFSAAGCALFTFYDDDDDGGGGAPVSGPSVTVLGPPFCRPMASHVDMQTRQRSASPPPLPFGVTAARWPGRRKLRSARPIAADISPASAVDWPRMCVCVCVYRNRRAQQRPGYRGRSRSRFISRRRFAAFGNFLDAVERLCRECRAEPGPDRQSTSFHLQTRMEKHDPNGIYMGRRRRLGP